MQVPRQSEAKSAGGQPAAAHGPGALLAEAEHEAREALAEHLRRCPYLPPSLAATLAADVLSISLPAGDDPAGHVETPDESGNGAAAPCRTRLPLCVAQQVFFRVSGELRERLVERHDLPPELADEIALHGRERALTRAMGPDDPEAEVEGLVAALAAEAALTPTLLLRALCLGHLGFFRAAMAHLAGLPLDQAGHRILDRGPDGFVALYEESGLPPGLFRAFWSALDVVRGLPPEQAHDWPRASTNAIISRLVNEYEQVCPEDLEHVLSQLSRRLAEPPLNGTPPREPIA
jgi:uncharacterized protein (DUF2336 family)